MAIYPNGSVGQNQKTSDFALDWNRMLELSTIPLEKWSDDEILTTIRTQFRVSDDYLRLKKTNWTNYVKLYLNQYRKNQNPETIGSKIIFSKFHEAYANFSMDERSVLFDPRDADDFDATGNLNKIADFDWAEFSGPKVWNEWLWDALFYSYGILDLSEWDNARKTIVPKVQDPFTFFFDPAAVSVEYARFMGRWKFADYADLINDGRLDEKKVREMAKTQTPVLGSDQNIVQAQRAKQILLGSNYYQEPAMVAGYFQILEWYMRINGEAYVVWTNSTISYVLGYEKLDYKDMGDGKSRFPFVFKQFYRLPRTLVGVGIPDIMEDDHRADVQLMNFFLEGVRQDSTPSFAYNVKALLNPKDLLTREVGKNIAFTTAPNGELIPYPKSNVVTGETINFESMLQSRTDSILGTFRIQGRMTATMVAIMKERQDMILAARAKEMTEADKEAWQIWFARYKRYMNTSSKKMLRVVGENGLKSIKQLTRGDFIPKTDPDIKIESKLMSEPKKVLARRDFSELLQPTVQAGGSLRESLRYLYRLIDLDKDTVTDILPPTPHEMRAEMENDLIDDEKAPMIHENDDDLVHIQVHMRAEDNKVREIHLRAHELNYLRKAGLDGNGKGKPAATPPMTPGMPGMKTPNMGQPGGAPENVNGEKERSMVEGILGTGAEITPPGQPQ